MNEVAKRRADKAEDNRLWSPFDALEDAERRLTRSMENGTDLSKIQLCICWTEEISGGCLKLHFSAANLTKPDHVALLELSKAQVIRDWLGE